MPLQGRLGRGLRFEIQFQFTVVWTNELQAILITIWDNQDKLIAFICTVCSWFT